MISSVVFDIDGVVVRPWRFRDWLVREHGITPEMTRPFFQGPFVECVLGRVDVRDVLVPFLPGWGWSGTVDDFVGAWHAVEHDPDPEVLAEVDALRARGVPCHAATVQEPLRARYLAHDMGFAERFDELFFSCDLGVRKPELAFFDAVRARLDVAPESLLLVDDTQANVDGARAAGWAAERFRNAATLRDQLARLLPAT